MALVAQRAFFVDADLDLHVDLHESRRAMPLRDRPAEGGWVGLRATTDRVGVELPRGQGVHQRVFEELPQLQTLGADDLVR